VSTTTPDRAEALAVAQAAYQVAKSECSEAFRTALAYVPPFREAVAASSAATDRLIAAANAVRALGGEPFPRGT
jgi:hypothetical protein